MFFEDEAIVLTTSKFSENAAVVVLLTQQHGVFHSMVKYVHSKKNRAVYQPGNCVAIHWQARLLEHLGTVSGELVEDVASCVMADKEAMYVLSAVCSLLTTGLPERDPAPEMYYAAREILQALKSNSKWQSLYVNLEMQLLQYGGFGLDLSCCAVTEQTDDLIYISPRTGRAVSRLAGKAYHDKLLPLPQACIDSSIADSSQLHFLEAFDVLSYFLTKHLYAARNKEVPAARLRLQRLFAKA